VSERMCALGNLAVFLWAKNHLGETFAIAQINKNHAAEIATRMHPAGQGYLLADISGAELVAMVSAIHGSEPSVWAMAGISQVGFG